MAARKKTLSTSGNTIVIDPTLKGIEYVYGGSGTLSGSITISPDTNTVAGVTYNVKIRYNATFELDGNSITIFSQVLNAEQARSGNTIFDCEFIGGVWTVHVSDSSNIDERGNDGVKVTTLTGAGGTVTLNPRTDYRVQELIGSGTLAANYVYQTGAGTPVNGDSFRVIYNASFAATGSNITIFGQTLTDEQALNGAVVVETTYNGSSWTTSAYQNPTTIFAGLPETFPKAIILDDEAANYFTLNYDVVLNQVSFWVDEQPADTFTVEITHDATVLQTLTFNTGDVQNSNVVSAVLDEPIVASELFGLNVTASGGGGAGKLTALFFLTRT